MSSPASARACRIFFALSEVPPPERAAALDRECGDDLTLRAEVEALLADLDGGAGPLDTPVVPPPKEPPSRATMGTEVGGFTLLDVLGTGGAGVVYRALQRRPVRTVALKVLRHWLASNSVRKRFEVEAEILGRLQHPGIAQVFAAHPGDETTPAHIAMELVDGPPITDYADAAGLDVRGRVDLLARVCDAVQHAHQRGVIHRDLKPANILVAADGQPKVVDFGVARSARASAAHSTIRTEAGQLLGTLPFMSPEQVQASPDEVDTRTDVYSLGVVLFRLLCGFVPFAHDDPSLPELARRIVSEAPPRLPASVTRAGGELDTIVRRVLAKDKNRRYASAADLAADLRRFLSGDPVSASTDSAWYVLRTRVVHYRRALAAATAGAVALAALAAYATFQHSLATRLSESLESELSASNIERGRLLSLTGNHRSAETLVWREFFESPRSAHALWTLAEIYSRQPVLWSITAHEADAVSVRYDRSGRRLLTAGIDGHLRVFDAETGAREVDVEAHVGRVVQAVFAADDRYVVSTGTDRALTVWALSGAAPTHVTRLPGEFGVLAPVPGSTRVVVARAHELVLVDVAEGRELAAVALRPSPIRKVAVGPTGELAAAAHEDGYVTVYDFGRGRVHAAWAAHAAVVAAVAFHPDGRRIATGAGNGQLRLWAIDDARLLLEWLVDEGTIRNVAFSADGRLLGSAGWWRASVWSLDEGSRRDYALSLGALDVAFSPDGRRFASVDEVPGRLYVWDLEAEPRRWRWQAHHDRVSSLLLVDDDRTLLTSSYAGDVRRSATDGGHGAATLFEYGARIRAAALSPSSDVVAVAGLRDEVVVMRRADGQQVGGVGVPGRTGTVAFDGDDGLVVGEGDGSVARWHWRDARELWRAPSDAGEVLAVLPWSGRVAAAHRRWAVVVRRLEDGAIERRLNTDTAPFSLARSPDGRWLAAGTWGGTVIVWETETWAQVAALRGHARLVDGVDFSADGLLLATASREGHARVWEVGTWRHLMATAGRPSGAERVKFLADGRHLIIGYDDGAVEVVDLRYFHRHVAGNAESRFDLLRQSEGPLPASAAEVLEWSRRTRARERPALISTAR